jgi:hypothetical protein
MEIELGGERERRAVIAVDEVAAGFGVLAGREAVADGPHPPADAVARFDQGDGRAAALEIARGDQAGHAGTGHEHRDATERRLDDHD